MAERDAHGPIDFVLLEFPDQKPSGMVADALLDQIDAGTIRLYDIVAVRKAADGRVAAFELSDIPGDLSQLAGARSGLLTDEDFMDIEAALEPGTIGVLLVYENAWAAPFVAAAREAGGDVVASARLAAQDVMDALDAAEAAG
jgi:hypothetical protein